MFSKWIERVGQTLGLRLAAWYLGTFLASTLVMGGLTYGLLASSLESRDHDVIQSTLREYGARYQGGGLPALARALEVERRSGQREPLFVRLIGPFEDVLLYSLPDTWGVFDLSELAGNRNDIWGQVRASDRNTVLEVATLPLGGGTVLQVGKTSESRDELLARFRRVLFLGLTAALAIGIAGGLFLTRSTLKPLRELRHAVDRILRTGQTDDRVAVYGTGDAVDELGDLFNAMLARITTLIHGMRNALLLLRPQIAPADIYGLEAETDQVDQEPGLSLQASTINCTQPADTRQETVKHVDKLYSYQLSKYISENRV